MAKLLTSESLEVMQDLSKFKYMLIVPTTTYDFENRKIQILDHYVCENLDDLKNLIVYYENKEETRLSKLVVFEINHKIINVRKTIEVDLI